MGADTKIELRARLQAARRALSAREISDARDAVRAVVLSERAARGWRCVAAYVPLRTEPGSVELLAALDAGGVRVIVPVLLADRELDWVQWTPAGVSRPTLGLDSISTADAVLVPALAVDRHGVRLGRGGGSYDRALRRARPGATSVALLYAWEFIDVVPREDWDVAVSAVVTPAGWTDVAPRP